MKSISCGFSDHPSGVSGRALLVQYGPTLTVDIGFDPTFTPDNMNPNLPIKGIHALVDTGATDGCIDSALAMQLNLPIIDQRKVCGVNGEMDVNMHLAQIHIPGLPHTLYGAFSGVNLSAGGQPHSVLIGRTFLQHFNLFYNGLIGQVVIFDEIQALTNPTTDMPEEFP